MDARNADMVVPVRDEGEMERLPLFDLTRATCSVASRPSRTRAPAARGRLAMAYERDVARLRHGPVDDPELRFRTRVSPRRPAPVAV